MTKVRLRGVDVLLVDCNLDVRELAAECLTRAGARVRAVGSIAEAREALATEAPDVLVGEMRLPDGDGSALVAAVRSLAAGQIPAVAFSAFAARKSRWVQDHGAGFERFVLKPSPLDDLIAAVATLVPRQDTR